MLDETFNVLDTQNQEQGQCFWSCKSCHSYALKFDKRMRNVETRVTKLENETIPGIVEDVGGLKEEIEGLKKASKIGVMSRGRCYAKHLGDTLTKRSSCPTKR